MGPAWRGRDIAPARTRCAPMFPGRGTFPQRPADPSPSGLPLQGMPALLG